MKISVLPSKPGGNVRAVTLVEILVSVGIIAVLAGLIFPMVREFGAKGKEAKCLGNHRAIIQSVLAYAADHRGTLPGNFVSGADDGTASTAQKLSPYLNIGWRFDSAWKSQWLCPSRAKGFDTYQVSNYAFSHAVFGLGVGKNQTLPAKMSQITRPSKTAAISCVVGNYAIFSAYAYTHTANPPAADLTLGQLAVWHGGRAIITFMDGHSQMVEPFPKGDPRSFWFSLNHPDAL